MIAGFAYGWLPRSLCSLAMTIAVSAFGSVCPAFRNKICLVVDTIQRKKGDRVSIGIGSAGYPTWYEAKKINTTSKEAPKDATAFEPESSDDVKSAWDRALAETGTNPFPMNRISTALVLHVESGQRDSGSTFLGKNVDSAKTMAENIIYRLENPLTPPANPDFTGQELRFYKKFLEFLEV